MRHSSGLCECIAVYVDNLVFVVHEPNTIINLLEEKYKYTLKDTCIISYHLGCNFFGDDEDILCMVP